MYKYFLGFRYLFSRPINILGVGGVAVGVWFLITVVAIFTGFIREIRTHIRGTSSDLILYGVTPDIPFPRVEKALEENPHVAGCAPRIVLPSLLLGDIRADVGGGAISRNIFSSSKFASRSFVVLMGVDPEKEESVTDFRKFLLDKEVAPSDRVDDPDHPFRVAPPPGEGFGKPQPGIILSTLNSGLFHKGERIGLATVNLFPDTKNPLEPRDRPLDAMVIKRDLDIAGFYHSKFFEHNKSTVYVHIDTARSMIGFDPLEEGYRPVFNEVAIKLDDPSLSYAVLPDLKKRLRPILATTPWNLQTWEQRKSLYLKAVDHERALMKLLLMISLVVAGFLIFATLSMMVTEKTRDIGILTALGATRTGILYIFLFCGFVISFLGSLLGSLAGWISCLYLNDFNEFLGRTFHVQLFPPQIYNLSRIPTELDLAWVLQVVAGAILLSLLFSLIPAFRASRFEPVKALRYE